MGCGQIAERDLNGSQAAFHVRDIVGQRINLSVEPAQEDQDKAFRLFAHNLILL